MKKLLIILFFPLYLTAFNLSLNSGANGDKPYSVLQLSDEQEFECVEQILAYDTKRYVCMLDDEILPKIEDTTLPLMDIKYKKQDGKLFIVIMPKAPSKLLNIKTELYNSQNVQDSPKTTISKHFSIIIDTSLSENSKRKSGLNFKPDFKDMLNPSIGALDLNKAPIAGLDSNDIDIYISIKRAYEKGAYENVVKDTQTAIKRHPNSLFSSEFLLFRLRALDKIFETKNEFEEIEPKDIVSEGRAWIRKFPSDENYPEVLYLIARAYLKDSIASDAKYMLDILNEEHANSKFTKLAALDYADYLYKIGRQKEALKDYEKVLYSTNDIDLASRAALSLADANIDKEKFDEAKKFILKIANANEKFFMNNPTKSMNLATTFASKDMPDVAAKIYEILINNSDRTKDFYEVALKNLALNLAKTKDEKKAYEYLNRYETEFKYGDYIDEVTKAKDGLFFEEEDKNATALHARYKELIEKYAGTNISQKALISELELDIKERKFSDALSYKTMAKDGNLSKAMELINEAALELTKEYFMKDDCTAVINLLENYDINKISLPQFKLFNCYYRTARYNDALELAKAHAKDENLEDRVEWLVNLSKILYKNKDYEHAIIAANDALSLGSSVEYSDPTPSLFDRFYSLLALKRFTEAISTISAIEQLRGQDFKIIEAYTAISDYAMKSNDYAIATTYAKKALELQTKAKINTFSPKINFNYSEALLKTDNLGEALDEAKFILNMKLEPEDRLHALNLISEIYIRQKQFKLASPYLNECSDSNFVSPYKDACKAKLDMIGKN
ncbi:tetratricopeptide repeat protein [Campylobacter concisus]|uniref:tetratricopeptide repeat protein n=1 Tax=Campylobacter concisus TaxID=199 RepID=UPI000D2FF079|nr:flagellar protein [Campylobacter concisus]